MVQLQVFLVYTLEGVSDYIYALVALRPRIEALKPAE